MVLPKITHSCKFLLQITRLKARGRQTHSHTSKREQCYSPANNQNSLPIWDPAAGCRFFQIESQNCPQSTCCFYCDNTLVPAPAAESNFTQLPPPVGSQPRGGGAGTSGSPGAPGSPSSFPSLRGSPLSRPRARGNSDPQPLGRPKSHPTRQPLTTADSAVATASLLPRGASG